jgi:hypothetical protein
VIKLKYVFKIKKMVGNLVALEYNQEVNPQVNFASVVSTKHSEDTDSICSGTQNVYILK